MYLMKIDIHGFKSFADKVTLGFDAGITAVLGPNGCGKSNVVDAVKWVLGESSAKQLRGNEMMDVIFAGSERRKPSGMAEVSLYFNNEDNFLPVEYNEVCITRRLYRSGESEYLINRQLSRKRDIRDLFMDTGIGTTAYSFIEQGKVEALLQAKPVERRAVFEEAAGISKYKQRRKETLARLDRTNQYLLRSNDRVDELEKGIRRISRQAAAARRHQRLKTELDALKSLFFVRQFCRFQTELEKHLGEHEEINTLLAAENEAHASLTKVIAELTTREVEVAGKVESHEAEQLALQEQLGQAQVELAGIGERLVSLERGSEEASSRAETLRTRLAELTWEAESLRSDLTGRLAAVDVHEAALTKLEEERDKVQAELAGSEKTVADLNEQLRGVLASLNRIANETVRAESETKSNQEQLQKLAERLRLNQEDLGQAQAAVGSIEKTATDTRERLAAVQTRADTFRTQREQLESDKQEVAGQLAEYKNQRAARDSRRATLEDLEANLAGTYAGPRAILTAKAEGRRECTQVEGMVVDCLTVPTEVALAIETILGGQAQDIIVENSAAGQECIEFLKRTRAGRATFLPLDRIKSRRSLQRDFSHLPGVLGEAIDLVTFDARFSSAMRYLLAGVLVVESLSRARELAAGDASGIRLVTLEGDVVSPHGAMTGGQGKGQRGGLVTRKAEREEMTRLIVILDEDIQKATSHQDEVNQQLAHLGQELQTVEGEKVTLNLELQKSERELSVQKNQVERLAPEQASLSTDETRFQEALTALATKRETLAAEQTTFVAQESELQERVQTLTQAQETQRAALVEVQNQSSSLREQRAEAISRVRETETRLTQIATDEEERKRALEECVTFAARAATEKETLLMKREDVREREADLLKLRDDGRQSGVQFREDLQTVREKLRSEREVERAAQKRLNEILEAQNGLKLRENECRLRLETVTDKAREELAIDDLAAYSAALLRAAEEEEAARAQASLSAEENEHAENAEDENSAASENESGADDAVAVEVEVITVEADGASEKAVVVATESTSTDAGETAATAEDDTPPPPSLEELADLSDEEVEARVADIAGKLQRIGPVNSYAIEELAELEGKASFQRAEQDDLQKASNDLLEVIRRLNQECKTRFNETFATVRENFQDLFRQLFGGGRADLVLEELPCDENGEKIGDELDAGIDVIAKPPGKEPTSIALLSGGEKALCAVALLFAIFRSKPSPFCILDEVDGPLDESNIDRFMNAVKDFTKDTQFILISHSKRTMRMTDTIHGVTQHPDDPGVSTVFNMRFRDFESEEEGGDSADATVEQLAHA